MNLRPWFLAALCGVLPAATDDPPYERSPIRYSATRPADPVAELGARIAAGRTALRHDDTHGYLEAFLSELKIPVSSQALVFSKTSFQRHRIWPGFPRALYFGDDVYVGWVKGGEVLEISSVDPQLGAVFYTLSQRAEDPPRPERQTHACLQCHDSAGHTLGVPGHIVRSVFPGDDGSPHFSMGTFRVDYRTPYADRWGGWYVTGRHGDLRHLGNTVFAEEKNPDLAALRESGANRTELPRRVNTDAYLAATSDIVALMVLEHQTYVHNLITRANHETRLAMVQSAEINRLSGTPDGPLTEGSRSRLRAACDPLVEALLFVGEPPLRSPVEGTSTFTRDFEARGPNDRKGRSLRRFDLRKRLFTHPCSYLVYSKSFAGLPGPAKDYVYARLKEILFAADPVKGFEHLSPEDRAAVAEILRDTIPEILVGAK